MTTKKEMDILIISPVKHLTPEIRAAMNIPQNVEGLTVVHVLKNQKKPSLETLQHLVGGYIERVPVYWKGHSLDGWINEEGKLIGMEPNLIGTALWYNSVLAQAKKPVWSEFGTEPLSFVQQAWAITRHHDWIAGPMVIYSSMFKEALRNAPTGTTLQ